MKNLNRKNNNLFVLYVKVALVFLLATFTINSALGNSVELVDSPPDSYVVVKGDTLWDISGRFLKNPWQWPDIWQVNPQIKNPHLIYPEDIIYLGYQQGRPILTRRRGGVRPTVKLSPNKRIETLNLAIPTIPLDKVSPFLNENSIFDKKTYLQAPYIVASSGEQLIASKNSEIYVKGIDKNPEYKRFAIYKKGKALVNPENNKQILAYQGIYLGEASMIRSGDPAILKITSSRAEILKGSRLFPLKDEKFNSNFMPKAAQTKKIGYILSQLTAGTRPNANFVGAFDAVIINFGIDDGIAVGDVFNIYKRRKIITDPMNKNTRIQLPHEISGNLIVFRAYDKLSYALVMDTALELKVGDIVVSPYMKQK